MQSRDEFLQAAEKIICNDRELQYGAPENSFQAIANLWSAYLGTSISAVDVGLMMNLFKIGRIMEGKFKADSYVDAIGYMACAAEIAAGEANESI